MNNTPVFPGYPGFNFPANLTPATSRTPVLTYNRRGFRSVARDHQRSSHDYVFNDDGIALISEKPIPDGLTALELSAFKNDYHKAISVIWILLDEQIQNQVHQSKS